MVRYGREDYQEAFDPFQIVPHDEPVFLLRAQDICASACVRYWAELNDHNGGDPRLSAAARAHAEVMDRWPVKKTADFKMIDPESEDEDHSQKLRTIRCRDGNLRVEVRDNGDLLIHLNERGSAKTDVRELKTIITRANLLLEDRSEDDDLES